MSERKLNKARTKIILTRNARAINPTDCSEMTNFICEESIDNIETAYTHEEIYSWSINLNDKEYECFLNGYTNENADGAVNYTKMIDWLKRKLNTNQEIALVGKGKYGFHVIAPSTDEKGELFCYFRNAVRTYSNMYVCVGRKSIEPLLTVDDLRIIENRKRYAKALKIFETMYLPTIKTGAKKLSNEITIKCKKYISNSDTYEMVIPSYVVKDIIRSHLRQFVGNIEDAGIDMNMYTSTAGVEVYFDIDKLKDLINNDNKETI